jgi:signal peptidase
VTGVSPAANRILAVIGKLKSIIIALILVVLIIGGLFAYSGSWPPLVVVESDSMQHSDTTSYIGVIDTGDLVIQKGISNLSEVTPFLNAYASAYAKNFAPGSEYMTYGEYGDVVIYRPLGRTSVTPIIHRALCLVHFNETGHSFDIPVLKHLPPTMWEVSSGEKTWYDLSSRVVLQGIGYNSVTVTIDLGAILSAYDSQKAQDPTFTLVDGLITMGDNNNGIIDQNAMHPISWCPVELQWIDGEARGEIPWFGLLKLWISGPAPSYVPQNSVTDLWIAIGLIIGVPILIDVVAVVMERKGIDFWGGVRRRIHLGKAQKEEKPVNEAEAKDKTKPPQKQEAKGEQAAKSEKKTQQTKKGGQQGKKKR